MLEVTVVVPVFNGERFLAATLDSVLAQSMPDFELIVVNDGSTDRTAEILAGYASRDRRINVVHQKNAGATVAANLAGQLAKAPYIARLDADDISLPNRLERQLAFLQRYRDVALLGSAAEFINEADAVFFTESVPTGNDEIKALLPERNVFVHSAVAMRRDVFLAVGGYRRAFAGASDDYDLWLRISERYEVANLSEVLVRYRVHRGQSTATRLSEQTRSSLGARVSARLRRSGHDDPFGFLTSVSRDTLTRLGIATFQIEDEIATTGRNWARVMAAAGDHDAALALAREAWREGRGRVVTRHEVGRFYVSAARASLARGRVVPGLRAAGQALWWQPALLGRLLRGGLRHATRELRGDGRHPEK
jgi:hypothetical protein